MPAIYEANGDNGLTVLIRLAITYLFVPFFRSSSFSV